MASYDALLLVSYGGPEGPDDVMPFLENVVRGKNVPPQRLAAVARHYELFDGVSPLNAENRALLAAVVNHLRGQDRSLAVYWGNLHWHPLLTDAVQQMAEDGVGRALAFATSAFGSYSSCRKYRDEIEAARQEVGDAAPPIDKLRLFYNHPGFIEPMAERVAAAFEELPEERREAAQLVFTAHSLPVAMAESCPYREQLHEACSLISDRALQSAVPASDWTLVYQSRSGPPSQPWLEPDVGDYLRELPRQSDIRDVVVVPVGFLAENMELVYDLDVVARGVCEEIGLNMVRSAVVGCHPRFVQMIVELVAERTDPNPQRLTLGAHGPSPDDCPTGCCPR